MRSYSKRAGFTGVRCAYTVVPKEVTGSAASGERVPLHELWSRRQTTKFNGVPYPIQRAAAAVYTPEGRKQTERADRPLHGQRAGAARGLGAAGFTLLRRRARALHLGAYPGRPLELGLLRPAARARPTCLTPGGGFGAAGEGYFRISAFNSRENVEEAIATDRARVRGAEPRT